MVTAPVVHAFSHGLRAGNADHGASFSLSVVVVHASCGEATVQGDTRGRSPSPLSSVKPVREIACISNGCARICYDGGRHTVAVHLRLTGARSVALSWATSTTSVRARLPGRIMTDRRARYHATHGSHAACPADQRRRAGSVFREYHGLSSHVQLTYVQPAEMLADSSTSAPRHPARRTWCVPLSHRSPRTDGCTQYHSVLRNFDDHSACPSKFAVRS